MEIKYLSLLFLVALLNADILPPGSHNYDRCVYVTNADSFPGKVLVTFARWGGKYMVTQNSCLGQCYRYDRYCIFWTFRDSLASRGLDGYNYLGALDGSDTLQPLFYITDKINPNGGVIEDADLLILQELYYRWYVDTLGKYQFGLWKEIRKNSDSTQNVIMYELPSRVEKKQAVVAVSNVRLISTQTHLICQLPSPENITLGFFDASGRLVARISYAGIAGQDNKIALPKLPAGTYLVKLKSAHYSASASVAIQH